MYRHYDVAEKEARTARPRENENEGGNAIMSGTRRWEGGRKFVKLVRGATQSGRKRGYHFLREEPSAGPTQGGERKRALVDTAKVDGKNAFDGRIFEVLTGPSADLHELRMNSSPDSFPPPSSAVSTSLYSPLLAKNSSHRAKLFVLSLGGIQPSRTKRMTPVTVAINKSAKVRRV